jgi:hypothetical protein
MTKPTDTERALRDLMRSRVRALAPPVEVYETVRRRHRQSRRRAVLAAGLTVVAIGVGIPVGLQTWSAAPPVQPPATTTATATASTPMSEAPVPGVSNGVRGSLAGDSQLLTEAVGLAESDFTDPRLGAAGEADPAMVVRPLYAEQRDGAVVVLVVGEKRSRLGPWVAVGWYGRAPGASALQRLDLRGGVSTPNELDVRRGEQYAQPIWVARHLAIGGRDYGVVIAPPGSRAELLTHIVLTADCSLSGQSRPVPLVDGTAFVPISFGETTRIRVVDGSGAQRINLELMHRLDPRAALPTKGEIDTAIQGARGQVDDRSLIENAFRAGLLWYANRRLSHSIVWAGVMPGTQRHIALLGERLEGGVTYLKAVTGLTGPLGAAVGSDIAGCLPTVEADRRVVAWRVGGRDDFPLLIIAPAGAVRADVVFAGGATVPVQLAEGAAFLPRAGKVSTIRAYDAAGNLLDQRGLGGGLVQPPRF